MVAWGGSVPNSHMNDLLLGPRASKVVLTVAVCRQNPQIPCQDMIPCDRSKAAWLEAAATSQNVPETCTTGAAVYRALR